MSTFWIPLLNASAETPGMPPFVVSESISTDTGEGLALAQTDFAPTDAPETSLAETELPRNEQTDLSDVVAADSGAEGPTPPEEETTIFPEIVAPGSDPDLWLYRRRTIGLLRRYLRLSIAVGRMPSLLGREFFRSRVTSYKSATFEDSVIFVHDVERCLDKLNEFDKKLIAKIVLQEYSQEEAGRQLGCGLRQTARCYVEALDRVTETFLKRTLLTRFQCTKPNREKSCQGGKSDEFPLSDSEQAENKY
ncbi:MAG TPA: hypothetical protein VN777_18060 [Terriglobales bacterium]|nr:hypothetical protein [Terriglobales bacterium]